MTNAMTLREAATSLRYVDDFPIEGIRFFDIESILENPAANKSVMDALYSQYKDQEIDYVAGFDARGFIFGYALSLMLGVGFKQIRKPGKLPGETESAEYMKEYGPDTIHMEKSDLLKGAKVLLIDDLLATGGTAAAGIALVEKLGGTVVGFGCIIELPDLGGRCADSKLHNGDTARIPITSLITISNGKALVTGEEVRFSCDPLIFDDNSGDILLVDRLSEPLGLAMAGGGIEAGESVIDTIIREVGEELGLTIRPEQVTFHSVLTGADRDPRGEQVSYVCEIHPDTDGAVGEAGKTEPHLVSQSEIRKIPDSEFAFADHQSTVVEAVAA